MATMNINFVSEPGPDTQATVDVFAPNAPGGTEMPGLATTSKAGLVKKASALAAPAAGADAAALVTWATKLTDNLKAAGITA